MFLNIYGDFLDLRFEELAIALKKKFKIEIEHDDSGAIEKANPTLHWHICEFSPEIRNRWSEKTSNIKHPSVAK